MAGSIASQGRTLCAILVAVLASFTSAGVFDFGGSYVHLIDSNEPRRGRCAAAESNVSAGGHASALTHTVSSVKFLKRRGFGLIKVGIFPNSGVLLAGRETALFGGELNVGCEAADRHCGGRVGGCLGYVCGDARLTGGVPGRTET